MKVLVMLVMVVMKVLVMLVMVVVKVLVMLVMVVVKVLVMLVMVVMKVLVMLVMVVVKVLVMLVMVVVKVVVIFIVTLVNCNYDGEGAGNDGFCDSGQGCGDDGNNPRINSSVIYFVGKSLWYDLHGTRNVRLETFVAVMVKHITQDFKGR